MAHDVPQAQPPTTTSYSGPPATSPSTVTSPSGRVCATAKRTSKGSAVSESTKASASAASSERLRFSGDSQLQWRAVRTVPTWVQRYEDESELGEQGPMLPPPTHKSAQKSVWDSQRENVPVTPRSTANDGSRWKTFAEHSSGRPFTSASERKDLENGAVWGDDGLSAPWLAKKGEEEGDDGENSKREIFGISAQRRQIWYKRLHVILLNNPMVPLTFRAIIWVVSLIALSLSAGIYVLSARNHTPQLPSTILAIVVDAIALIYIIYITYDEYSGKPLGLRSPTAKIRLIMFDLVFIIFDSANLSLAFDTLNDVQQSCSALPGTSLASGSPDSSFVINQPICTRQRALASFLFLALCAWVSTFMVSVFRLVERVSRTNA
ncbi:hypothetical protein H072_682 [Dactylellina haptotyla CBS 200.50]|uniref:Regulator of phospholipase D SRF1 n=1 Tax=Dactylellina haptotyla (strain CBS 200.50) TaxID=1284197 RepID=S8CC40_DACHA|nr:hypothetical protein H072_682 [Dactylellina haptotyla CBS 200.50]